MLLRSILLAALTLWTGLAPGEEPPAPADQLWQQLQTLQRAGPEKKFTTIEERRAVLTEFLAEIDRLCEQFIREFPDDKRIWEARLDRLHVTHERAALGVGPVDLPAFEQRVAEIVDSPHASKPVKAQASLLRVQMRARHLIENPQPDQLDAFDQLLNDFRAAHPNDPASRQFPLLRVQVYEAVAPAKATDLLKELLDDKNPALANEARRRLKARELQSQPLDLKFTAVDGTEFDLARWRGKVVLVDFWATWCGPCLMELPNLLDAYKKLNPHGFEIVGISLDRNKERLVSFTRDKGMPWPQYFDGQVWENKISTQFGITRIPTMWLVDKKGFVRATEIRGDLEAAVRKLLDE